MKCDAALSSDGPPEGPQYVRCVLDAGPNSHEGADVATIPGAVSLLGLPVPIHRGADGREWTRYGPFTRAKRPGEHTP